MSRARASDAGAAAQATPASTRAPALALFVLLLPWAGVAAAQGIALTGGSGTTLQGVVLEEQAVRARVVASFQQEVRAQVERLRGDRAHALTERAMRALADARSAEYMDAVTATLNRLAGDGVLHAKEVADAIGPLREERMEELVAALHAVAHGFDPPPVSRSFESRLAFARALVRYTFTERNGPASFAGLAGAIAAGLALVWLLRRLFRWLDGVIAMPRWARALERTLRGPLYLAAAALGVVGGLQWVWIPGLARGTLQAITGTLLLLVCFWALWNLCGLVAGGMTRATERVVGHDLGTHRRLIVLRTLRVVVVAAFLIVVIHNVLDSDLTGLLAGLGVVGLALSFALRGSIENIAASFTIFGDEPFQVGDILNLDDVWGTVEDIGFRSTRIRTFDNHLITIPNKDLVDGPVHNVGARGAIRRRFRIGLVYGTPAEKIREAIGIVESALGDGEHLSEEHPPHVVFESFGDYDLRILVQYHYTPPDYWAALAFDSEVNLEILEEFRDAGIEIAFPTVSTELHDADGVLAARAGASDASGQGAGDAPPAERDAGAREDPAADKGAGKGADGAADDEEGGDGGAR